MSRSSYNTMRLSAKTHLGRRKPSRSSLEIRLQPSVSLLQSLRDLFYDFAFDRTRNVLTRYLSRLNWDQIYGTVALVRS